MISRPVFVPSRSAVLPVASLLLAGCTAPPPPNPPPPGGPTSAPVATVAPAPAATEAPSAAAAPPPAPESPFHVIAESGESFALQTVGNTTYAIGPAVVAEVNGQGLVSIGKGREDLPVWGVPAFVGGRGDKTFLSFLTDNGRIGYSILFERRGDGWKEAKTLPYGTLYAGIGPWKGGSVLAATMGAGIQLSFQKPGFSVLSGARGGEPRLPRGEKRCPAPMFPTAMLSFESGDVVALGPDCRHDTDNDWAYPGFRAMLARWTPGKPDPTIVELAARPEDNTVGDGFGLIVGRSPDDVWLSSGGTFGEPFFLHFDGKNVTKEAGVPGDEATSMAVAADGTLHAVIGGALHRRAPAGGWEEMVLPEGHTAASVAVTGTDVWVASSRKVPGEGGKELVQTALLHLGPPPSAVQKVPPPSAPVPLYKQLRPVTPGCKTLFVMMYAFTKVTPPDYDFPLTRKALKGKLKYGKARFVVTEVGGKKYFGAFVPDVATGRDLTALIEKEVNGSKPAFVCSDPTVVSDFKLDLTTGERTK